MTKSQLESMTVEQKALKVYNAMNNPKGKEYNSIEEACKAYDFAPASYYNYAKKFKGLVDIAKDTYFPQNPTTAKNWADEVQALRKENEELKKRLEQDRLRIFKLERKVVNFVIGEAQA